MKIIPKCIKSKRHLCASGSILLPLAQKWGLVGVVAVAALSAFGAQSASAASLTLSTPSNLSVNVTPSATGTFAKSAKGTITVKSDAYAGYTLKIQDKDSNSALEGKNGSIPSITEVAGITESTFNSDSKYNNMWGYRPSKFHDVANTNFLPSPSATGDVIETINPSNSTLKSTDYTVELGVRVDNSEPAGTYTGTFIFSVTANNVPYNVTYNLNGGTGVSTLQKGDGTEGSTIAISKAPTRDKYVFLGWCDKETKNEACNGNVYQPNGAYKLVNGKNELNLYAMWAREMQNWNECNILKEHETVVLADNRDANVYKVRKLKDNKCWMVDNLRLGNSKTIELTPNDTDISEKWSLPESKTQGFDSNTSTSVYVDESYGGYYAWCAATAGTCTKVANDDQQALGSICPKGWRMPTGNQSGEAETLHSKYNSSTLLQDNSGPNFIFSGHYEHNTFMSVNGYYWSSTSAGKDTAYSLSIYSDRVDFVGYDGRYNGFTIRCIARE